MLFPFQLIKLYDINHLNNSVVNKLRTNTETVNNPLANGFYNTLLQQCHLIILNKVINS